MRQVSDHQKLRTSGFTQTIMAKKKAVIYHSLFGNPNIITPPTLEFLKVFDQPHSLADIKRDFDIKGLDEAMQILIDGFFLNPVDFDEREHLGKFMESYKRKIRTGQLINFLSLVVSESCNFSCSYCFADKGSVGNNPSCRRRKLMDFKTAQKAVDVFFELMKRCGKQDVTINFGGGEPLLNFRVIRQILAYIGRRYSTRYNINFVLNTNCSKITNGVALILKQNKVSIAASLDGLRDGNDAVRIYRDGRGTFDDILEGWKTLREAGIYLDGFMATVNQANFHLINEHLIDFAHSNQMKDVRIDIDVIHQINIPLKVIVGKLLTLRRYGSKLGVMVHGFWDRPLENLFNSSFLRDFTAFCGGIRGNSFVVDAGGNVYLCGYSLERLGNIFVESPSKIFCSQNRYYQIISSRMPGNMLGCSGCAIEGQCAGGCYVAFETDRRQKSGVVARNCKLYRTMTKELLKDVASSQQKGGD